MIFAPTPEIQTASQIETGAIVLEALVFTIKMNYFGIPVNQIESIQSLPEDTVPATEEKIDRIMGFTEDCFYLFPSRITFKSGLHSEYASRTMIIDGLVGIFEFRLNHLLLLPKAIESRLSNSLIWAAARLEEQGLRDLVLLLNFNRLASAS